ncbi:hypothetical protein PMAYCL1PPCAC_03249, partial [Pristionchus mayeri]
YHSRYVFFLFSTYNTFCQLKIGTVPLNFSCRFTDCFEINLLRFHVKSELELENSMQLIDQFPRSKYAITLKFQISLDKLMSLPPMEEMQILFRKPLNSAQLFQLISLHKVIYCYHATVDVNWAELKQAMEMISSEPRERTVRLCLDSSTVSNWLRLEGFSESSKAGDSCRKFQIELAKIPDDYDNSLLLRNKRCSIKIDRFRWDGDSFKKLVTITN